MLLKASPVARAGYGPKTFPIIASLLASIGIAANARFAPVRRLIYNQNTLLHGSVDRQQAPKVGSLGNGLRFQDVAGRDDDW
jgi:hypothetical protein